MSKISVITINYNDVVGLEKTILSVINQTNVLLEYIVIDGNSSDGSKEIIKKYKDKITYSVSEDDSGIYNAMNKGIKVATGDYLLFMNGGDVLVDDDNILAICSKKLKEDIVAFDCFLEKNDEIVGRRTHISKPTLFYVYKNGFKHQSTFIKKSLFDKLGHYNERYKIAGDYEFWIRCFLDSKTTAKSYSIPIAKFQLDGISQTGNWGEEHRLIEKEWLGNLIEDFHLMEKLLPYKKSRVLNFIIKLIRY
ncbi:glycosyltransferase involved in cell wall biosynthesis [Wenyingzhuangia heitensis]|uniref:Glycosyltransferase involved in cell wall biosynthesis n=1 Tax=Wenyingzhuangia heitensis TaxID=1487859 RepID=A0ABX0U9A4_9FLAO|nr:glycosyltransferase family 2 protein [Wenyingzhuangia heitensis]NIJ45427.1 glycosyltransferase involved in cell wall biosynthesis [Wenyingzhuangia heitensis]